MATGPDHYRQAEELLDLASTYGADGAHVSAARCIAEAQVHATLAQAAAIAAAAPVEDAEAGMTHWEDAAWYAVCGVKAETAPAPYDPHAEG